MKYGLVIGGTQFIGKHIVEKILLEKKNLTLFLLNRGKTPFEVVDTGNNCKLERIFCDRFNSEEFIKALQTHKWDFVIDLLVFSQQQAKDLCEGLHHVKDTVKLIMISTDSVYEACQLPNPLPNEGVSEELSEKRPIRKTHSSHRYEYGKCKLDAEDYLINHSMMSDLWILRLPDVIGEHDNLGSFLEILEAMENEKKLPGGIIGHRGEILLNTHEISLVYAGDVARLIVNFILDAQPSSRSNMRRIEVLNVASPETPTLQDLYAMIFNELRKQNKRMRRLEIKVNPGKEAPIPTVSFGKLNVSRLLSNSFEMTPLQHIIGLTCKWYEEQSNRDETKLLNESSSSSSSSSSVEEEQEEEEEQEQDDEED